ncbi:MAG: hypothetical protein ACUZ8E_12495 [Candidatus Anammoxibacter sp.]
MKKLLFIFLIFPLLVFGQAEKTHRAILIDSIKAFNGGIIDVKDTVNFEKPLKGSVLRFTDDVTGLKTLAELAAGGAAGDSSFTNLEVDTISSFLSTKIILEDTAIFNENIGIGTSAPSSKLEIFYNPGTIQGLDITSNSTGTGFPGIRVINTNTTGNSLTNSQLSSDNGTVIGSFLTVGATGIGGSLPANNFIIRAFGSANPNILFQTGAGLLERMRITTTGQVLIGITSSSDKFHVVGNSTLNGNVGINTASVSASELIIDFEPSTTAGIDITSNSTGTSLPGIRLINTNASGNSLSQFNIASDNGAVIGSLLSVGATGIGASLPANNFIIRAFGSANPNILFQTGAGLLERMRIETGGNIGIGISSSITAKLHIAGINAASGTSNTLQVDNVGTKLSDLRNDGSLIIGNPTGGAKGPGTINAEAVFDDNVLLSDAIWDLYYDGYVREEDKKRFDNYTLWTIEQTNEFTKKYRHLPTMPGRAEWKTNGKKSIGEIITGLWETVELQQIQISELNTRISQLER